MPDQPHIQHLNDLEHLRTPDEAQWTNRPRRVESDTDPRPAFERDRDRIIHSEHLRHRQHKSSLPVVPGCEREGGLSAAQRRRRRHS